MKYLLLLIPIVLISLCSYLPELPFSDQTQTVTTDLGNSDIFIKVEVVSSEIREGREAQIFFEIRNKQSYDLENVEINVYDHPCFSSEDINFLENCGILGANQSCVWSWRWKADETDIDKQCPIKFSTTYKTNNSLYQDIAVLPKSEYQQREIEGTLGDVPIGSSSTKGPLNVYLTFSEPQPFMAGQTGYGMNINYNNRGNGFFDDIEITLNAPDNINLNCSKDYGSDNVLDRELEFIKGRAVPSQCTFDIPEVPIIDIKSLSMEIDYTYKIYNSFPMTVKGK